MKIINYIKRIESRYSDKTVFYKILKFLKNTDFKGDLKIYENNVEKKLSESVADNERLKTQLADANTAKASETTKVTTLTQQVTTLTQQLAEANAAKTNETTKVTALNEKINKFKTSATNETDLNKLKTLANDL